MKLEAGAPEPGAARLHAPTPRPHRAPAGWTLAQVSITCQSVEMDLDRHLLALIGVQPGEPLVPGARLVRVSSELGWRLTIEVDGAEAHLEIAPFDPARRHAAATARLAVSYRLDRSGPGLDAARMRALCAAVARSIASREEAVLASLEAEARSGAAVAAGTRIREVEVGRILEPMGSPTARFYGLSPYVGCLIGCRFCYAQSRLRDVRRLTLVDDVPWGSYVDVRVAAPELLRRELPSSHGAPIKFCPIVSDPYHAVERRYRLTRRCLEVLRDERAERTVLVLTRSAAIVEDAGLLASIPGAHAGVSLPTVDEDVRRHFEPRGATISERLEVLSALRAAGVRTFAIVQPLLPGSVEGLADALAARVGSARIDVLRGVEAARDEFDDPRWAEAETGSWQAARAAELADALRARGVELWSDDLPPGRLAP